MNNDRVVATKVLAKEITYAEGVDTIAQTLEGDSNLCLGEQEARLKAKRILAGYVEPVTQ